MVFKYYNTIEFGYLGGFIVDTQEAYQGWQLWKSMPVFASLFSGIAADCLLTIVR